MSINPQHFEELELVAEKAGELNDRVGKIESELGAQTKTLESAALVLDAAIKGIGALKSAVLENDIAAVQLSLNDKTAHLAKELSRFEMAVSEIDRRAESGDAEIKSALAETAQNLRAQLDAKMGEVSKWSERMEKAVAEQAKALAAIPPVIKGADAVGMNPVGEWQSGRKFKRMDVVSYAGSSYISNEDDNSDKPTASKKYTVLSKRGAAGGMGGVGDMAGLTGTISPSQLVPGSSTYAVGDVLYAGTTGALSKLAPGTSGQLLSTQGNGAAPIWVTATGGAGDVNGPASATDNAIARYDGTGGKTIQNSTVTVGDTGAISGVESVKAATSAGLILIGSGGTTVATFGPGGGTGVAFNSSGFTGVNSITAATATDLTLAGGTAGTSAVKVSNTTASTSTTTGALQVAGGLGVAGAFYGGSLAVFGTSTGAQAVPTYIQTDASFANSDTPTNQQLKHRLVNVSATEAYGFTVAQNAGIWYHSGNTTGPTGYHVLATGGAERLRITTSAITATIPTSTVASTTSTAGLRIPHGAAPTSPVNGDIWTTTAGLFVRINGVTVGPLS